MHRGLDELDPVLDEGGMLVDVRFETALPIRDPLVGLFPDAGHLGLRPLSDAGDVRIGLMADGVARGRGFGLDLLDARLRALGEPGQGFVARGLRRLAHGPDEADDERVFAARRRRNGDLRRFGGKFLERRLVGGGCLDRRAAGVGAVGLRLDRNSVCRPCYRAGVDGGGAGLVGHGGLWGG